MEQKNSTLFRWKQQQTLYKKDNPYPAEYMYLPGITAFVSIFNFVSVSVRLCRVLNCLR